MTDGEFFMETQRIGDILRVCAIDAETGTEVVLQVPLSTARADVEQLAIRKLRYVLKKEAERRKKEP